jgi:glycosyltransferase involved in cell wall biosynthesis
LFYDITIPKISIFLPIYNKEKYLKRSISSIQNQSLKEIEIIAINDFSTDKTLNLLKTFQKFDKRIKIINNKKNYGLLYSRAMGIKNSRGEYIMNLDPDDELAGNDNLEFLYNKIKNNKVDVLSYSSLFKSNNNTIIKCSNFDKILFQPQIFESAFDSKNMLNDYLIWNKLIKKNLFKKVYKLFEEKIYKVRWNFHEDNIWSLLINKYSRSMLCTNKLIYIYYSNEESFMENRGNIQELNNLFNRHNMFTEILTKKREQKYIEGEITELIYLIKENFLSKIKNSLMRKKIINIILLNSQKYKISNKMYECFINDLVK